MPVWMEGISGVLIAVGTLFLAWKAVEEVRNKGEENQTQAWVTIRDTYEKRMADLEARGREDRQRIRDLEASEYAVKQQSLLDRQRIQELERVNRETADRLSNLEADHARVVKTLKVYRDGIGLLIAQLRKLGTEPEWTPPLDT